jgi:hypothetical protein
MQAIKWFMAAVLVTGAVPLFGGSKVPEVNLPDWVQQAAGQPKGTYPDDTNAVVLLDETSIHVISSDQYTEHKRRVVRILRPEGRREAYLAVEFQAPEKANDLHAWSIDASGHKFEVKMKEFILTSPYQGDLYTDDQLYATKVPGVDAGSVVAFEFDINRKTYRAEYDWVPQEEIPIKNSSLTIELPPSWEYSAAWANSDDIKPQQAGSNTWKWSLTETAGIHEEPLRLNHWSLSKRLEIAFFGDGAKGFSASWGAIGTWYKNLSDPRRTSSPELRETAQRLAAGKSGFDAQVRAIASFAQRDIRYVEISIGIGGHQPHFASDVFRHKYGDCKDKAAMMATMLLELGYHSDMVLVDTRRGFVNPKVPSIWFDHAILAISLPSDIPDGAYPSMVRTKAGARYVIFDPTNEHTPFGLIPSYEQNSYALIATSPGELVQLPLLVPELNTTERAGKFALASDGVLTGDVVHKFTGDEASDMRRQLDHYDGKDRAKFLEAVANASLKQTSVETSEFQNLKDIDRELLIKYQVKMPGYAQNAGGLLLVRPRVFGDKALHLPKKQRHYAIELEGSRHDRDIYEIAVPAGYVVDELPENTHVDVGFASYDAKIESLGNTIRYTREYIIREPHIELSKLEDVKKLENAIAADQSATAVLKKAP